MRFPMFCCAWNSLCFLIIFVSSSASAATPFWMPRLNPIGDRFVSKAVSSDFKTNYYNQTLDHFNYRPESYTTFRQRYEVNAKYWKGPNSNAAILVYLGAEAPIDGDLEATGFVTETAMHFNSLVVYIEHRYYGQSIPFGPNGKAMKNASTLGYFDSAQALADYAEIIVDIRKQYKANRIPLIVMGGSYGGMLAAWFRLKYPHLARGALASSAPLLYFEDIIPHEEYYDIVTRNYREASQTCVQTIKSSWSELKKAASQPNGLSNLSKTFKTCQPLKSYSELQAHLHSLYTSTAQYNAPPEYPVTKICGGIDGAPAGSSIVDKIAAGLFASSPGLPCYVNKNPNKPPQAQGVLAEGWTYQSCTEIVFPLSIGPNSMLPKYTFNAQSYSDYCKATYGLTPRLHWITTYYGGHDFDFHLKNFGSNIIFSNGLRDPYSAGGVLKDISKSIVALTTVNGSHCLDILTPNAKTDPNWLVQQRQSEVNIMKGWINQYYIDLKNYKP